MLVLKLRSCTFSPFLISLASLSPHSSGTSESASAYTSTLKVQLPSSMGKKVTEAVICRKMDWISACISASVFSSDPSADLHKLLAHSIVRVLNGHTRVLSFRCLWLFSKTLSSHSFRKSGPGTCQRFVLYATQRSSHRIAIAQHALQSLCS